MNPGARMFPFPSRHPHPRPSRPLRLALPCLLFAALAAATAAMAATVPEVRFLSGPAAPVANAVPPLPSSDDFPVQLVLDDDQAEGAVGVGLGGTAEQFLWFNRFTPGGPFHLEEVWVLFPLDPQIVVGSAIEIVVFEDDDGDPTNGATLLGSFARTVQVADGNTFSVYPLPGPITIPGGVDVLIGVVPRFLVTGVTPFTTPAALDTSASAGRSWLAIWNGDPPSPVALPGALFTGTIDGVVQGGGNWMIRGFGSGPSPLEIPTLDLAGLALIALLLVATALYRFRRRSASGLSATVLALALVFSAPPLSAVTIDSFTTNQTTITAPPGGATTVATGGADILGAHRGLEIRLLQGAGPTSTGVAGGTLSMNVSATTPDSRGEAVVTWDGDTNPTTLDPTGLGGVDLTNSNHSGFRVLVNSATAGSELVLDVYTTATARSSAARRLPAIASPTPVFVPFSEFRIAGATGADFTDVGAIVMTLRGTENSMVLDQFETSGPSVGATKSDLQIVDTDGDGRVDPGDRVRYTVTITNSGNEALAVDLNDTIDPNTTLVAASTRATPVARNDQYGWYGNVTLGVDGTPFPTLLANDQDPDGGAVTVQSGTFPATSTLGGTLTLDDASTGAFTYVPPTGFSGVDSFAYTIVDGDANTATATAFIDLRGVVWFVDDSNTTPPFNGTLADPFQSLAAVNNAGVDPDGPGDTIFVFADDGTPYAGGLGLEADQTLLGQGVGLVLGGTTIVAAGATPRITNAAGAGLTLATNNTVRGLELTNTTGFKLSGASFGTFTADNLAITGTGGGVTLGTGTVNATFSTIVANATSCLSLNSVSGTLNVTGATTCTGSASGLVATSVTGTYGLGALSASLTSAGNAVNVATSGGATFNFNSLALSTTSGAGFVANSGTFNIAGTGNTIAATGGPAVDLTSVSLGAGATFSTLSSSSSGTKGINLDTVTGAFTANGGSVSNSTGICFDLNGGSSTVTYAGSLSCNTSRVADITGRTGGTVTLSGSLTANGANTGINVASNTGGTINFSGSPKSLSTSTGTAVTLATNNGATINFTGGNLAITTSTGGGFNATGGATGITVQGAANTITSGSGTALNVASSTIGAAGLTYQSISSNGGANGIVLNTTGANGGVTVTGSGGAGTGGTIQNKAIGISLNSTRSISLSRMQLNDFSDFAIRGDTVNGFTLDNSVVSGANGNNAAADEGSIRFSELTGTATFTNSNVSGGFEDNLRVVNTAAGSLTANLSAMTIGPNSTTDGNDGVYFEILGAPVMTMNVTVQNSFFTSARGDLIQVNDNSTSAGSALNLNFTGNTLSNNHPGIATGGGGVSLFSGTTTNDTFTVQNNTFRDAVGPGVLVVKPTGTGTLHLTFQNNSIGVGAAANSGSSEGSALKIQNAGQGAIHALITGNQFRWYNNFGIELLTGGGATAFAGQLNATITGNTIANPGTNPATAAIAKNGIHLNAGTVPGDTYQICLDAGGAGALQNSLSTSGAPNDSAAGGEDIRLRQRQLTTVQLRGYGGANNDNTAVQNYIIARNAGDGAPSAIASNTVASSGGGFVNTPGGAACTLP